MKIISTILVLLNYEQFNLNSYEAKTTIQNYQIVNIYKVVVFITKSKSKSNFSLFYTYMYIKVLRYLWRSQRLVG